MPTPALPDTIMTQQERRTSASLALLFALRMPGLFLVLPFFSLEARRYPGGDAPALVGLREMLRQPRLRRLNLGVFVLHVVQLALMLLSKVTPTVAGLVCCCLPGPCRPPRRWAL